MSLKKVVKDFGKETSPELTKCIVITPDKLKEFGDFLDKSLPSFYARMIIDFVNKLPVANLEIKTT